MHSNRVICITSSDNQLIERFVTTREAAWYIISVVSVCLSIDKTLESLDVASSYLCICAFGIFPGRTGKVHIWRSSSQGQGHMSKNIKNPHSHNVKLRSAITPVFIKNRAMKFARSMGVSGMTDRIVWSLSLSRDRNWPRVIKCTSRVIGLRLESNLVVKLA